MESFPGPHHNYMRPPPLPPPPPSMADPHHHQRPPQASPWYHPPQSQHHPSPSPPPQQQQQHWAAPLPYAPHPNPHYPPPHPNPYPTHYAPPQRPPHISLPPPPYSNSNQDWGNQNWVPHAGWENQAHNNGEDWAAKARAWAAARNAMENQHPSAQSHYSSMQTSDSHYHDSEQTNVQYSTYQNYPAPAPPVDKQHMVNQSDPAVSSVHAYYAPDVNFSYARKDGNFSDLGSTYLQQDAFTSPSVHKQEVPSSYSSIPGGHVSTEQEPKGSGGVECMSADQSRFPYGNQSAAFRIDPCDQPLQFTPRFNHDNNPMMLSSYPDPADPAKAMNSVTHVPTFQSWKPPAPPNISFPSVPPTFPSAAQLDPTISMPPLAGQPPPMLGRSPVPSFHSTMSSLSSPVGLGTGTSVHPATAFHGDMYGTPMNSERPKKAAVPNWLRDEIIKKKDVIVSSGTDKYKEESESIDDEPVDKSFGKSDQADSKSIDSSRSTEEDEDEDSEEAVRNAAINQEIKRVLTEVLLKVTSDLFDEIATRVLSEDENSIEAKNDTNAQNQKLSAPVAASASASKVTEKVLISSKTKEPKSEDVNEKSSSGADGDVLGLVNYASDDDEEEKELEMGGSAVPKSEKRSEIMSSGNTDLAEGRNCKVETPLDSEKLNKNLVNAGTYLIAASTRGIEHNHASQFKDMDDHRSYKNGVGPPQLAKPMERKTDSITDHSRVGSFDDFKENNSSRTETIESEAPTELVRKASKDDFREKDSKRRDRHENRSSSARDSAKEAEMNEARENDKGEQRHGRHDERHQRRKNEDHSGSKERSKEQGVNYDSKKQSPHRHTKEFTKEVDKLKKAREKDDVHRKSERSDRSKHKHASDRGRHKRRRSSSVDSRDIHSKDNSAASYSDNSTDEASEKSKRKMHLKKRNLSPSPVRSRRRQVSQSPPSSKASQRRHSPYSSLEASRGKRSRSRSPAQRRR